MNVTFLGLKSRRGGFCTAEGTSGSHVVGSEGSPTLICAVWICAVWIRLFSAVLVGVDDHNLALYRRFYQLLIESLRQSYKHKASR